MERKEHKIAALTLPWPKPAGQEYQVSDPDNVDGMNYKIHFIRGCMHLFAQIKILTWDRFPALIPLINHHEEGENVSSSPESFIVNKVGQIRDQLLNLICQLSSLSLYLRTRDLRAQNVSSTWRSTSDQRSIHQPGIQWMRGRQWQRQCWGAGTLRPSCWWCSTPDHLCWAARPGYWS